MKNINGVLERCSENMQQIYWRPPIPKLRFRHGCPPVNLLHIFRGPFPKNTPGGILLLILPMHFSITGKLIHLEL